jgi:hypothetical protein
MLQTICKQPQFIQLVTGVDASPPFSGIAMQYLFHGNSKPSQLFSAHNANAILQYCLHTVCKQVPKSHSHSLDACTLCLMQHHMYDICAQLLTVSIGNDRQPPSLNTHVGPAVAACQYSSWHPAAASTPNKGSGNCSWHGRMDRQR